MVSIHLHFYTTAQASKKILGSAQRTLIFIASASASCLALAAFQSRAIEWFSSRAAFLTDYGWHEIHLQYHTANTKGLQKPNL